MGMSACASSPRARESQNIGACSGSTWPAASIPLKPTFRIVWLLRLTEQAKPKLDELKVLGDRTRAEALTDISEGEHEQLIKLLTTLKSNLASACATPPVQKRASHG